MAKKITFTQNFKPEPFKFILSTRYYTHQGLINNVDKSSIVYSAQMNGVNEITFTVYKEFDGVEEPLWDDIQNLKLVYIPELNEYFEISFDINESSDVQKCITGKSLCEAELGQTMLYNIEINTENDIARDDYVITKFYNPNNTYGSLLHRILEKAPHYSIKHVDDSLKDLQRSFSINGTSIYDFFTNDCAKEFNCLFLFDSTDRTISVYDLYTVCLNDSCEYYVKHNIRYRDHFQHICPICGSKNLYYYGEDTTIFVDKNNLTNKISFTTNVDDIKNTFRLEAGDDDMTAAIINNNQNGSAYLYYFSDETKADMPNELVDKIDSYEELYNSYYDEYQTLTKNAYDTLDQILYLTSTKMPQHEDIDTNAQKEAEKLNVENLSPIGLQNVSDFTSVATVNSALKNYGKVYIYSGRYRIEVYDGEFSYEGIDDDGNSYGYWTGNFLVTNYSDEEDYALSETITVKVYDNYTDFLNQRILKQIAKDDNKVEDHSIYDVLGIIDLNEFKQALTYYCLNRLISFYDAIQSCLDILVQVDQASEGTEYYEDIYIPYYNKLMACQNEIDIRQSEIDTQNNNYNNVMKQRKYIQNELNFKNYLGEELYNIFCMYRREDTYSNQNYISDNLDNTTIFENANQFINVAKKEIKIAGTPQHSISSDLYNLLLMEEFQPIVNYFELGNYIRIKVNEEVYRLRLTSYRISFNDLLNLNTEFSDLSKVLSNSDIIKYTLDSAQQMATSYSYVAKQAEKGNNADNIIEEFRKTGLDSSLYKITNADTQDIIIDNHGITGRNYDDILDVYEPEQIKITNNTIAFTDDNWETVKLAIGKASYTLDGIKQESYGVNAEYMISGKIIGGDIYSINYDSTNKIGTHIDLKTGNFSFAGEKLKYDGRNLTVTGYINAIGGVFAGDITVLGNISGGSFSDVTIVDSTVEGLEFSDATFSNPTIINGNISNVTINNSNITTIIDPSDSSTRNTYTGKIVKDVTQDNNGTITCTYLDVINGIIVI